MLVLLITVLHTAVVLASVNYSELYRPLYHFSANSGWINDPCGPSFFDDKYHLFFQYNPNGNNWAAPIEWGHAVSHDLIHWEQLPNAVLAGPESYDNVSAFTGSVIVTVDEEGKENPVLFYTGVTGLPIHWTLPYHLGFENLEMATTDDNGMTWKKSSSNPLLEKPIVDIPFLNGRELTGSRDPFVFRSPEIDNLLFDEETDPYVEEYYYLILGTGYKSWADHTGGGFVPLYRSKDLTNWTLAQDEPLLTIPNTTTVSLFDFQGPYGCNWEVPNLFFVDGKVVMDFGVERPPEQGPRLGAWVIGQLMPLVNREGNTFVSFIPENIGVLDYGNYYAANGFEDPTSGTFIQYGWVAEERDVTSSEFPELDWSGVIAFPRELALLEDASTSLSFLQIRPAPLAVATVRQKSVFNTGTISNGLSSNQESIAGVARYVNNVFPAVFSQSFELQVTIDLNSVSSATAFGISVLRSADGLEQTIVEYDHVKGTISIIREASSGKGGFTSITTSDWVGKFPYLQNAKDKTLKLEVFVDKSIVEVFANSRFAASTRVYPSSMQSSQIALLQQGGNMFDSTQWKELQLWTYGEAMPE
jgi:beta-fructofuranosidase